MRYAAPTTIREAATLIAKAKGPAFVLAGGTDLLVRMKSGTIEPELVVDIKRIPATQSIRRSATGFRIGAGVPTAAMGENKALKKAWPGVVEAANLIGSDQIQNRCTIVGNLCNASPAADSVPALIAAGATCTIAGPSGTREAAVEDIVTAPGQTSLAAGELVVDFLLPKPPARSGSAYLRMIPRSEMDIAIVGAAVSLSLNEKGHCTAARVALGAVAATPLLVPEAADALIGTPVDDAALAAAGAAATAAADPIDDKRGTMDYRRTVAGVLTRRAAQIALDRARRS